MRTFNEIFEIAAARKGGAEVVEALLEKPKAAAELRAILDDRWLAQITRSVFQAGFNWKVVERMWPGFEAAFHGFDIGRCGMMHDEDFDRLISDKRIVRHGAKIKSVQANALFLLELRREHGSAGAWFADWPDENYAGLLKDLKARGSRLGGATGQYFLRIMGKDSYLLSRDVVSRLIAEGVIDKPPSSQKAMAATQEAFNIWRAQSGRSLMEISRILALSV